ncbi:uncharacterized protein Z520_09108 [Fonsecaea multimorphosa CBS 102226]|uniref:Zn(2)-C6 fungal-type domain-containing protein n=1 Tax=Fonsecaea multimorphosa CBS 102226 TaxID=1442371 RepID=A0A0D2JPA4_9EURO|nr:uncharacterized protein Z520_09108 [Fonsecaea multimorphosa CBS 102226]KIX95192.1 hypothetical protein Z520_09108 [Fonsecaea multimorphosa CBS 102226]
MSMREGRTSLAPPGDANVVMTLRMVKSDISFDTSERSSTDCKTCWKRRVVCDRTMPSCWKCKKKEMKCPGYRPSANFNWTMPLTPKTLLNRKDMRSGAIPAKDQQPKKETRRGQSKGARPESAAREFGEVTSVIPWSGPSYLSTSPGAGSVIKSRDARRLLDYYCNALSVKLPWVDLKDNPWRTTIVPAALNSDFLLNTILSMATEEFVWATSGQLSAAVLKQQAKSYQTRALELLSHQLALDIAHENARVLHSEKTIQILATVLLLCNLEMRKPDSSIWRVHLKAAHTLIRSCSFTEGDPASGMARFLITKCASLSVFGCMSNFRDGSDDLMEYVSISDGSEFLPFLRILQRITLKNRRQKTVAALPPADPACSREGCVTLRGDLIQALQETSSWVSSMAHVSASMRHDLEQVGHMFYLAGLIYGHQALQFSCCSRECEIWGSQIIDDCGAFHQLPLFSQDILWPLFIAGTTFGSRNELQEILTTKIQGVATHSGHRNALPALSFLKQFWACQTRSRDSWISFAADWTQNGGDFVII